MKRDAGCVIVESGNPTRLSGALKDMVVAALHHRVVEAGELSGMHAQLRICEDGVPRHLARSGMRAAIVLDRNGTLVVAPRRERVRANSASFVIAAARRRRGQQLSPELRQRLLPLSGWVRAQSSP